MKNMFMNKFSAWVLIIAAVVCAMACLDVCADVNVKRPLSEIVKSASDFKTVVLSYGSTPTSLRIGEPTYINGKFVVPANIDFNMFTNSGKFIGTIGSGHDTIVISKMSTNPVWQIFDTSLTVLFSGAVSEVRPEWWYDGVSWTKAIQKAVNTGLDVQLSDREYEASKLTESICLFTSHQNIKCAGTFDMTGKAFPLFIIGQYVNGSLPSYTTRRPSITGLYITATALGGSGTQVTAGSGGILFRKTSDVVLENIRIWRVEKGIYSLPTDTTLYCLRSGFSNVELNYCRVGFFDSTAHYYFSATNFFNCTFEANEQEGMILSSNNCAFHGCIIEGNGQVDSTKSELYIKNYGSGNTSFYGTYFESTASNDALAQVKIWVDPARQVSVNFYGCRGSFNNMDSAKIFAEVDSTSTGYLMLNITGGYYRTEYRNIVKGNFNGVSRLVINDIRSTGRDLIDECTFTAAATYYVQDRVYGIKTNEKISADRIKTGDSATSVSSYYGNLHAAGDYYAEGVASVTSGRESKLTMWGNPQTKMGYLTRYAEPTSGFVFDTNGRVGLGLGDPAFLFKYSNLVGGSFNAGDTIKNGTRPGNAIIASVSYVDTLRVYTPTTGKFLLNDSIYCGAVTAKVASNSWVYSGIPLSKLHIKASEPKLLKLQNTSGTTGDSATLGFLISSSQGGSDYSAAYVRAVRDGATATSLRLGTNGSASQGVDRVKIDSNGIVSVLNTTSSTSSTTGALVVSGGLGAPHATVDSLRIGSSGSRFKELKVIDGTADTLSITVGAKTWKILPVANQ